MENGGLDFPGSQACSPWSPFSGDSRRDPAFLHCAQAAGEWGIHPHLKAESRPGKPNADDAKRIAKFKAGEPRPPSRPIPPKSVGILESINALVHHKNGSREPPLPWESPVFRRHPLGFPCVCPSPSVYPDAGPLSTILLPPPPSTASCLFLPPHMLGWRKRKEEGWI